MFFWLEVLFFLSKLFMDGFQRFRDNFEVTCIVLCNMCLYQERFYIRGDEDFNEMGISGFKKEKWLQSFVCIFIFYVALCLTKFWYYLCYFLFFVGRCGVFFLERRCLVFGVFFLCFGSGEGRERVQVWQLVRYNFLIFCLVLKGDVLFRICNF